MDVYTDYPFEVLGDVPYTKAPVRKVKLMYYDGNKYCDVLVEGIVQEVKLGYLYSDSKGTKVVLPKGVTTEQKFYE